MVRLTWRERMGMVVYLPWERVGPWLPSGGGWEGLEVGGFMAGCFY